MFMKLKIDPPRCTAQHKGERIIAGRYVHHYEKKPQRQARLAYLAAIREESGSTPVGYDTRYPDGRLKPLQVLIDFIFKAPTKKQRGMLKTTRPDLDNMAKGLLDCLTEAGLLADDSQITTLRLRKSYGDPGVAVTIVEEPEPQETDYWGFRLAGLMNRVAYL